VYGQIDLEHSQDYVMEEPEYVVPFDSLSEKDKMNFSFGAGVSFGKQFSGGDYFSNYYQPTLSYSISPKMKIISGLTYVNSQVNSIPVIENYQYQPFSGNISQFNTFIAVEYKLMDNLIVGGSVFYDLTKYNYPNVSSVIPNNGLDNLGFSGYAKYKVSDHFTIEAEVRINDRNPYFRNQNNPFSSDFMGGSRNMFGR
jgi:hypothetical protein